MYVAGASAEIIVVCYVASGEIIVEQNDRINAAGQGDIVVFDGARPVTVTARRLVPHDLITLTIPKQQYAVIRNADDGFGNILLTRCNSREPIFGCLGLIAEQRLDAAISARGKLTALYQACVSLLPLAAGCLDDGDEDETIPENSHYLLPKILRYLRQNVCDPELNPQRVAQHFGISVRYLHRIFAASGSTFRSFVVAKRLQHIRDEMVAAPARTQGIATLARKWGFEDISTFNKAFRKHFGCAPGRLRQAAMR